jgi:3-oxoacyl-[acyl-carrier protein] reductase
MNLGLQDRVALVTGASSGLGRGIAEALIAEGARVAISSSSKERIEQTAAEIGARPHVHDSRDLEAAAALVEAVEADLGPVDVLVTNTGGPPPDPDATAFTVQQWQEAYTTLLLAPLGLIQTVLPGMRERGFGRIVSVSSTVVREPAANLVLSTAHRTGLLATFKTLARQVAGDGVTLNSVLPGRIDTARLEQLMGSKEAVREFAEANVPAGRVGTVEEFAAVATFLCSEQAGYVTGTAIPVDGALLQSI